MLPCTHSTNTNTISFFSSALFTVIVIFCSLIPLYGICQETDKNQLEKKSGLYYEKGSNTPYTGKVIEYYDSGKKKMATEFKAGQMDGRMQGWYENGQIQAEGVVKNNQYVGLWTAWHANGKKLREGEFIEGKEEGIFTWWFKNGNIKKQGVYHNGIADGKWEWFHENGQKQQEGFLKGDTNIGIWKNWYASGKQEMEGSFKNGQKEGEWIWWNEDGTVNTRKVYKDGLLAETNKADKLDTYLEKTEFYTKERNFKEALINIEKAISTVEDKSEQNPVYLGLELFHSSVYSLFQHVDEAESVLLKSIGLSKEEVEIIVTSIDEAHNKKLEKLAAKLEKHPQIKTRAGLHIALSLIYNILSDEEKVRREQQLAMEIGQMSDRVLEISMALYRIRGTKQQLHSSIKELREKIKKEGESKENQLVLAEYLLQLGLFDEPAKIADKYLSINSKDVDFLLIKTNIEMGKGNYEKMKEYENQILAIDPNIFDRLKAKNNSK